MEVVLYGNTGGANLFTDPGVPCCYTGDTGGVGPSFCKDVRGSPSTSAHRPVGPMNWIPRAHHISARSPTEEHYNDGYF
eukprot:6473470-Amphidinium_carterae.1